MRLRGLQLPSCSLARRELRFMHVGRWCMSKTGHVVGLNLQSIVALQFALLQDGEHTKVATHGVRAWCGLGTPSKSGGVDCTKLFHVAALAPSAAIRS